MLPSGQLNRDLETLGWGHAALAERLGMSETNVRRWRAGTATIPPAILAWVRTLAEYHRALPPPQRPPREGPGRPVGEAAEWSEPTKRAAALRIVAEAARDDIGEVRAEAEAMAEKLERLTERLRKIVHPRGATPPPAVPASEDDAPPRPAG